MRSELCRLARRGHSSLRELAKQSLWERALAAVLQSKQRYAASAGITAAGGSSHWQAALLLWEAAAERGGISATNATIAALGRALQWELATKILMRNEAGVEGYSSALFTAGQVSAWHHCLALLTEMHLHRVQHNSLHWSATASACGKCFMWERALDLISFVDARGRVPTEFATAILKALQVSHQWEQAVLSLSSFGTPELVSTVAEACQHGHAWEAALSIGALEAAMWASAAESQWQQTLALFDTTKLVKSDPATILSALVKSVQWQRALQLLETHDGGAAKLTKVIRRSLIRAWGAGHHWRSALTGLNSRFDDPWAVSSAVCACQAAGQEEVARNLLSQCFEQERQKRPHRKELQLLEHLLSLKHTLTDTARLLSAIEDFAKENRWLKVAGEDKSRVFQAVIKPSDQVLELGTYFGFSALLIAQLGCQVTTIEADPFNAAVAQRILDLADECCPSGAAKRVTIRVGRAADWLSLGNLDPVDVLILDHRGTIYHEDLRMAEPLLRPGARVLADNVLHPGAPFFVHDVRDRYDVQVHALEEFGMPELEDWLFVCQPKSWPLPQSPAKPAELRRWNAEVNKRCHDSQLGAVDWQELQSRLRPLLLDMLDERAEIINWKKHGNWWQQAGKCMVRTACCMIMCCHAISLL